MTAIESSKDGQTPPNDTAALRHEIQQTRQDLGETVEALAAKADVKARAHEAVAEAKANVKAKAHDAASDARGYASAAVRSARENPMPWLVVAGVLVALGALLGYRRAAR